jgi:hypothetical protein
MFDRHLWEQLSTDALHLIGKGHFDEAMFDEENQQQCLFRFLLPQRCR